MIEYAPKMVKNNPIWSNLIIFSVLNGPKLTNMVKYNNKNGQKDLKKGSNLLIMVQ